MRVQFTLQHKVYGNWRFKSMLTITWHRVGKHPHCNLLMADGSVIAAPDQNGDGLLNPGFSVPTGLTPDDCAAVGYRDERRN